MTGSIHIHIFPTFFLNRTATDRTFSAGGYCCVLPQPLLYHDPFNFIY